MDLDKNVFQQANILCCISHYHPLWSLPIKLKLRKVTKDAFSQQYFPANSYLLIISTNGSASLIDSLPE